MHGQPGPMPPTILAHGAAETIQEQGALPALPSLGEWFRNRTARRGYTDLSCGLSVCLPSLRASSCASWPVFFATSLWFRIMMKLMSASRSWYHRTPARLFCLPVAMLPRYARLPVAVWPSGNWPGSQCIPVLPDQHVCHAMTRSCQTRDASITSKTALCAPFSPRLMLGATCIESRGGANGGGGPLVARRSHAGRGGEGSGRGGRGNEEGDG